MLIVYRYLLPIPVGIEAANGVAGTPRRRFRQVRIVSLLKSVRSSSGSQNSRRR